MSYSRVDGKDTIIFVEPEEHKEESPAESKDTESTKADGDEGQAAAFDPETGEINWDCPCKYSRYYSRCCSGYIERRLFERLRQPTTIYHEVEERTKLNWIGLDCMTFDMSSLLYVDWTRMQMVVYDT